MQILISRIIFLIILLLTFNDGLLFAQFNYEPLDELLTSHVKGKKVDYKNLTRQKSKLITFTREMGKISPRSHPANFTTNNEKLAYWINAYNAFILRIIVENYPVDSIRDINFIGVTIWLHENLIGGEDISFKALEDDIIRDEFMDPRIHFAINCASYSCPPLLNRAYLPNTLDQQLDLSTRNFINDKTNFLVNEQDKKIYLSSIFDWYEEDFYDYLIKNLNFKEPHLLDFIKLYYDANVKDEWYRYDLDFFDYNWDLNDL